MSKVRHHSRRLPHGGGSPGGAEPEVSVDTELKNINGKECSFRPLGNHARKAYILMGVATCVTKELLLKNKEVLEASRMTKWNTEKQQAEPTNMVKIILVGKQHPVRFTRGYGSFRLRPFGSRPLKCFNCQNFGHQVLQVRGPDLRVLRGTTRIDPVQGQRDSNTKVRKLWTGACRLCPKKLEADSKVKPAHRVSTTKHVNRITAPIPLKNAWVSLTIQEVGNQPSTQQTTTIEEPMEVSTKPKHSVRNSKPMEVSTKPKHTVRNSKPFQNRKPEPVKVVSAPQQAINAWTRPFVPSIMEFPVAMSENRSLSGPLTKQDPPVGKLQAIRQQNEEQMDDVLETIQIALTGATSLLRKISTGNTRLVPALKKIMEAAMYAINTLTV